MNFLHFAAISSKMTLTFHNSRYYEGSWSKTKNNYLFPFLLINLIINPISLLKLYLQPGLVSLQIDGIPFSMHPVILLLSVIVAGNISLIIPLKRNNSGPEVWLSRINA